MAVAAGPIWKQTREHVLGEEKGFFSYAENIRARTTIGMVTREEIERESALKPVYNPTIDDHEVATPCAAQGKDKPS